MSVKQPSNPPPFNGQHQGGWNTNQNQMKKHPLLDGIPTKIKWKNTPCLHCISSFEGTSYKELLNKPPDLLFLVFYISFYISRHHFLQIFRFSLNIVWKKIPVTNFPFLINSIEPPTLRPLNGQNLLSVMNVFRWCFL